MGFLLGIDLGGTKVEAVIIDADTHKTIIRKRVPTGKENGYEYILDNITQLAYSIIDESGVQINHIGIGTPGCSDPDTGLLKNSNTTCMNGMPFHADLMAKTSMPVRISNDANCFAVAETIMGAVGEVDPDAKVTVGLILGTGVGSGIVINGKAWDGKHGIGGEWGHITMEKDGHPCYCGRKGCTETVLSGPSLERYYKEKSGNKMPLKDIVAAHRNGKDSAATATMGRLIHYFGYGMGTLINFLDPDVIVVGGGVGNIDEIYTDGISEINKHLFNPVLKTPIIRPKLGDSAGVFGAALL